MEPEDFLDRQTLQALGEALREAWRRRRPMPERLPAADTIPAQGLGASALPELWRSIVDGSTALASPLMSGHMDTAPHPVAALTDALVSALNNNLLFRELSPFASEVEEQLCRDIGRRLGLPETARGTFASGGSLANLSALFAASGGFDQPVSREHCRLLMPECAHASVAKAAAVLGIGNVVVVPGDEVGRMDPQRLRAHLLDGRPTRDVVVAVLGSTVHGAVEALEPIASVCHESHAWLHVDAVYGGALAFSRGHRHLLQGIECADSVAVAPHKWMGVPRLSAMVYLRDGRELAGRLGYRMPYSASGAAHRGAIGLQGSRRADALTLWVTLQVLGADAVGRWVDEGIVLARSLHRLLAAGDGTEPSHQPQLNVLCMRQRGQRRDDALRRTHARLEAAGRTWLSLSEWRGEPLLRAVLLNPRLDEATLEQMVSDVKRAVDGMLH